MNGQPPGGWIPAERLTLRAGARTPSRAARPMPASPRTGSARSSPGKWADFIIIDRDPTKVDAQRSARTQVLETWVAGKKVWARA